MNRTHGEMVKEFKRTCSHNITSQLWEALSESQTVALTVQRHIAVDGRALLEALRTPTPVQDVISSLNMLIDLASDCKKDCSRVASLFKQVRPHGFELLCIHNDYCKSRLLLSCYLLFLMFLLVQCKLFPSETGLIVCRSKRNV